MYRATCTSEKLKLSAHHLATRIGHFAHPAHIEWGWGDGSTMSMRSDTNRAITFYYKFNGKDVEPYSAQLMTTAQPLGGVRYWWQCPRCYRRVAHLYGGRLFLCRHCHKLTYAIVQERRDLLGTIDVRLRQLHRRLNGEGNFLHLPNKPKWMRWRTYSDLADEYQELFRLRDNVWIVEVCKALGGTYVAATWTSAVDLDEAARNLEKDYNHIRRKYRKHN